MQKVSSSLRADDSYMYGKLLEFLRVSSLDPEFSIKRPDPEVLPSWVTERNSRSSHDICVIQYYRTEIQNQNQNQNQNQFEIIRNSSTVPVPEFQYQVLPRIS